VLALALTAACGGGDSGSASNSGKAGEESKTFTIASTAFSLEDVPSFAAVDALAAKGYHINYEALSGTDLVASGVVQGSIQLGILAFSDIALAIQHGGDMKAVMSNTGNLWQLWSVNAINSCADLNGKRLAIHSATSVGTVMTKQYIKSTCPDAKPKYLIISGSENRYAALAAGQIDATPLTVADAALIENKPADAARFHALTNFQDSLPDLLSNVWGVNTKWAQQNPTTLQTFLGATLAEVNKIHNQPGYLASLVDKYKSKLGDAVPDPRALKDYVEQPKLFPADGGLSQGQVSYSLKFLEDSGTIKPGLTAEQVGDYANLAAAVKLATG
jgi:NitT/TauT family transport system substrate-binding protein